MSKKQSGGRFAMDAAEFDAMMRGAFKAPGKYPEKGKGARRKKKAKKG